MKGNPDIIAKLNQLLTAELTSIDNYFVHSKVMHNLGYTKLESQFHHEMEDEQGHASKIVERIVFLEGIPAVSARLPFKVERDVKKVLEQDLDAEMVVKNLLGECIDLCFTHKDFGTLEVLEPLLIDTEEDHIDWLETQLSVINEIGIERYLSEKM